MKSDKVRTPASTGKIAIAVAAALVTCGALATPYEIGEDMQDETFWTNDPVLFVQRHRENGFAFTSDQRDGADSRLDGGVMCFGLPVYESRLAFGPKGGVERVELMLYARGGTEAVREFTVADGRSFRRRERIDRTMTRGEFSHAIATVRKQLSPPGAKVPQVKKETAPGGARQASQTWPATSVPSQASLTWNYAQDGKSEATFRPGFIRLVIDGPARLAAAPSRKGAKRQAAAKGAKKIASNVIDESKGRGDVFVDNVPMVDQGQKGYCAVATAERVLRYYGLAIDEHQLAEAAGTTAEGGTSSLAMKNSIEAIGGRFRLGTVVCYGDFDKGSEARIAGLVDEVRVYNKAAKKLKRPAIEDSAYISHQGATTYFDPGAVDRAMDPEVLKEMKVNGAQKSKFKKFKKDIHDQVLKGIPLIWSVKLGVYPEPGIPQTAGYHMRLVIGYNDKKDEILYSDSWGAGHELKRMPAEWAWTITRCLMYMKPL